MSDTISQPNLTSNTKSTEMPRARSETRWWLKSLFKTGLVLGTGLLLIVAVGAAQRMGWIRSGEGHDDSHSKTHAKNAEATASVRYICPMMCTPTRAIEPGRCPTCGMELAPVEQNAGSLDKLAVHIDPAARRIVNIQTATAESTTVLRSIRTVGVIAFDETRLATISAYTSGRIEKLFADYRGANVVKGGQLVELYSPDLYAAQVEYLVLRGREKVEGRGTRVEGQETGAAKGIQLTESKPSTLDPRPSTLDLLSSLEDSAREKLREFGMTAEQIGELETRGTAESRTKIRAPIGGTVIEKSVTEGQYLKTGDVICRIADLSVVWLKLRLFPDDIGHIRYGQRVEAEVQSVPGEVFTGRVAFIDPVVDEKTRTIVVRIEMLNPDGRLRPGDFATATVRVPGINGVNVYDEELAGKWISPRHPQIVRSQPGTCPLCRSELVRTGEFGYSDEPLEEQVAIVVPRDAVLMAGSNSVVYVETKPGRFEIRRVIVGPMTADSVVIVAGIKSGETVATAGNFLIDSQMQLSGKPSLIDPSRAKSAVSQIAIVPSDSETK